MLSKKSSLLFSSYANLSPLYYSHSSSAPHPCGKSCRHTFSQQHVARQTRTYARHVDAPSHRDETELLHWPEAVRPHKTPTPYQILRCRRGELYTKRRFYALVKLYHPDRSHSISPIADLPLHVRLERYRMLVAAHDILSDIEKRKAYDAWGHGWAGHHHTPSPPAAHEWEFDRRRWATDPRNNATWEDWERWRHENEGGAESDARTIQLSNFTFISLIFAFVSIGGVVQGTRFSTFNSSVIERRDQMHREASTTLQRSKNATLSGDREERIRTFLDHKEAQLAGEASYQRLLPPAETCAPEAARGQ
jgi:curved DNA-binding protein CbpA